MVRLPDRTGTEILGEKAPQCVVGLTLIIVLVFGLLVYAAFIIADVKSGSSVPEKSDEPQGELP